MSPGLVRCSSKPAARHPSRISSLEAGERDHKQPFARGNTARSSRPSAIHSCLASKCPPSRSPVGSVLPARGHSAHPSRARPHDQTCARFEPMTSDLVVIVDDQHLPLVHRDRCRYGSRLTSGCGRPIRPQPGAATGRRTRFPSSAHRSSLRSGRDATRRLDARRSGQPQSATAWQSHRLRERLEYALQVLAGDPHARVTHLEQTLPSRCSSVTVIWPPGSVNFAAFSSRLVMTCFSRSDHR